MDTELGIRLGGEGRESEAKHKQHNVRVESSSSFVMREMSLHLCRSRVCVRSRPPSRDVRYSTLRTEFPECIAHTRRIGGVGWIPPSLPGKLLQCTFPALSIEVGKGKLEHKFVFVVPLVALST